MKSNEITCVILIVLSGLFLTVSCMITRNKNIDLLREYTELQISFNKCKDLNIERVSLINKKIDPDSKVLSSNGDISNFEDIVDVNWIYLYYDLYYCGACRDSISAIINSCDRNDTKLVILTSIDNERIFFAKASDIIIESDILFYNLIDKKAIDVLDIGIPIIFQINNDLKIINPFVFQRSSLKSLRLYFEAFFKPKRINHNSCIVL